MSALQVQYGMDIHVLIHVQEEEYWILSVDNVFALQEIGTVLLVLFVLILRFGVLQNFHVFVLMVIGMDSLALNVLLLKFGSLLH